MTVVPSQQKPEVQQEKQEEPQKNIKEVIQEEVKMMANEQFQKMLTEYLSKKDQDQSQQIHHNIICDGCNTHPIQGIRYKCSVCLNFDFCEKCEATKTHPHPFLKVRKNEQAPAFLKCSYGSQANQSSNLKASTTSKKGDDGKRVIHQARFVRENISDRHKIRPGEIFIKSWTFRNNGGQAWPDDTHFIQTNGDIMGQQSIKVDKVVGPGQEITLDAQMTAPELPGKYCAFYRFVHGDNYRFGQKVWCDVLVEAGPQSEEISSLMANPSEMVQIVQQEQSESSLLAGQDPFVVVGQQNEMNVEMKPVEKEELKQQEDQQMKQEQVSEDEVMKKLYIEELENSGIKDQTLLNNMRYMMNMGYYNFKINYNLLKRNNNDLIMAVNKLCNNMVTDTMFEIKK